MQLPDLISKALPAVVQIDIVGPEGPGNGSGFAIKPEAADGGGGVIVTNAHVVKDASKITVRFHDDRVLLASVRISDESTDIALLRIEEQPIAVLDTRPLAKVRIGESVVAIGSPYGESGTVTSGIVSGLDRTVSGPNGMPIDNMIETDALMNPGNSGGPLVGTDGRVIAVNSQVRRDAALGGSSGLGFAVPVETAVWVYSEVCETGESTVQRSTIGARINRRAFTDEECNRWGQRTGAVLVDTPHDSTPAAAAGLKRGDVIVAFDAHAVDEPGDIYRLLNRSRIGASCEVTFLRDGEKKTTTVVPALRRVHQKG
jgi:S1-C subfamily serine protease